MLLIALNQNLTKCLTYNEDNDSFGVVYDGVWHDVIFAGFQTLKIYENGQVITPLNMNSGEISFQGLTNAGNWTLGTDNIIGTAVSSANYRRSFCTANAIDLTARNYVHIIMDDDTEYVNDIRNISGSRYLVFTCYYTQGATNWYWGFAFNLSTSKTANFDNVYGISGTSKDYKIKKIYVE